MVLGMFDVVWECVGKVLACCLGFGQLFVWMWDVFWLAVDWFFFGSRSLEDKKVEAPEPLRPGERTTGRAAWVVVCVFLVGLLDCLGLV